MKLLSNQGNGIESDLLIQFTSSLFQLKELNLKCKTIVEQQLIEFENELVVNVLISHQFVKQDSRYTKGKQVAYAGRGDKEDTKMAKNIITRPDNSSASHNSYYRSSYPKPKSSGGVEVPLDYVISINLLLMVLVVSSSNY